MMRRPLYHPVVALTLLLLALMNNSNAQNDNGCNVQAILTPANDTVVNLSTPAAILFQSASINATHYTIQIDNYSFQNQPVNWGISPGLTVVKLVAYNGSCSDTAVIHVFGVGQYPSEDHNPRRAYGVDNSSQNITGMVNLRGGGYLLSAQRQDNYFQGLNRMGYIIKTKEEGCLEWSRAFPVHPQTSSTVAFIEEAEDESIYVVTVGEASRHTLHKLDDSGNRIWSLFLTGTNGLEYVPLGIETLPDGGIAMIGRSNESHLTLLRLNATGSVIWQRSFRYADAWNDRFSNLLYKDNFIYLAGDLTYNQSTTSANFITKVNYATGEIVWLKKYERQNGFCNFKNMVDADSVIVVGLQGHTGVTNVPGIGGYLHINTDGDVLRSAMVGETYVPSTLVGPYNTGNVHIIKSGSSFYLLSNGASSLSLQPLISYGYTVTRLDSTYQPVWVERDQGVGAIIYYQGVPAPDGAIAMGGQESAAGLSPNLTSVKIINKIVGTEGSNPAGYCYRSPGEFQFVPQLYTAQPDNFTENMAGSLQRAYRDATIVPFYPAMRFKCPDYVDSCSYLKITGPDLVCNLTGIYTYRTHKNKACGQPTQWSVPDGVEIIGQTDSTVFVRFPAFARYVIYGTNPLSCVPVQDSIVIMAESKTPPLDLGPDTEICPQNLRLLRAGPSFLHYEWQDGTTDSTLLINEPGQYWVKVTDSCGNVLRDTINITQAPPVPISIGPDRIKCNNDTLQVHAPAGFMNYTWGPDYNIISGGGTSIVVNPQTDTIYTVMAEATPGCFGYDTIRVRVFHSPPIDLGPDRSFCQGDSAVLNAGAGFDFYNWNTGPVTPQITVYAMGEYVVQAVTADGCMSRDTLVITRVHPLPVVQLENNPVLCAGDTRILDAGNGYAAYLWNDGSLQPTLAVQGTGDYSVLVTDVNGCQGVGATSITRVQPLPANFLPADTSVCSYGSLTLQAINSYTHYTWSTGQNDRAIVIRAPGEYVLEVTDADNCRGRDTVLVKPRQCLEGFFAPSAFTPNGDGRNDTFRPLLFGNIAQYQFAVYNRWGQVIFMTKDPDQAWDGRFRGVLQGNELFVWTCQFQLEGEAVRVEKGTVLLVR